MAPAMVELMKQVGTDSFLKQFADSPVNMAFAETFFADCSIETRNALLDGVDESSYSLRDWIEALRTLGHWLDARGLVLEHHDQVGYVCCAAESAAASAQLTHLPSLVDEMLETYGCERAEKK